MKKNIQIFSLLTLGSYLFLEILHAFIGVMIWNLDYYVGGPEALAGSAVVILCLVFLVIPLQKKAGPWKIFLVSFFILGLCRGLFQIFSSPLLRIIAASLGTIAWLWLLVSWYQHEEDGLNGRYLLGASLASGTLLDVMTRSWLTGYDLIWRRDTLSLSISLLMIAVTLLFSAAIYRRYRENTSQSGTCLSSRLFLLGPWFFLSMALYHNMPAIGGAAGVSDSISGILATGITAISLAPILYLMVSKSAALNKILLGASGLLLASLTMIVFSSSLPLFWVVTGAAAHMLLLVSIFGIPSSGENTGSKTGKNALSVFLMFFVLIIFIFLYGEFKLREVIPVAAGILFLGQVIIFFRQKKETAGETVIEGIGFKLPAAAALLALIFSFLLPLRHSEPLPVSDKSPGSLKIMTYNIHQAFDCDYRVDLESIAEVIKSHNPDILCLQEVNRGQIVTGLIDSLALIREELRYHTVYGPNHDDGQYGNAILSRYPIKNWQNHKFKNNIYETRGMLEAEISTPGAPMHIYVTHLDFLIDNRVRTLQAKEVLAIWNGKPRSIICGDFNAEPDSSELKPMYTSGLREASRETGQEKKYTFHESRGEKPGHIDYFYYTEDVVLENFTIDETKASDHMPLLMKFRLKKD